jgi:type I restriction enzyme S subunit
MLNQTIPLNEVTRPTQWKTLSTSELKSSGYPVYGANGIIGFYSEYTHKEPTLMITCRGATCGNLHISKSMSYINGNAMALDDLDTTKFDIQFLYYFLKVRGLNDVITGSAQPQITRQTLSKVNIPLVDLKTQKHIAEVLDRAEALKQKRQQALTLADDYLKATFLTLFGDPITNPKGWPVKKLSEVCSMDRQTITPFDRNGLPYLGMEHIESQTGKILVDNTETIEHEVKGNSFLFNSNHILYGKLRPYLNKVALPSFEGISSTELVPIKTDTEVANKYFISFVLSSNNIVDKVMNANQGARMPRTNMNFMLSLEIGLPPKPEQDKFEQIVKKVEALKAKMQTSQTEIDHLAKSLSQKAFRGELTQN